MLFYFSGGPRDGLLEWREIPPGKAIEVGFRLRYYSLEQGDDRPDEWYQVVTYQDVPAAAEHGATPVKYIGEVALPGEAEFD